MSTWAIGDIQGCADSFDALLAEIAFDPAVDRLWLVGDLVNRGPASGRVLDRVAGLGDAARFVLGNHDLAFVARHLGLRKRKKCDTLDEIFARSDIGAIVDDLVHRPVLAHEGDHVFVHAGLHPHWTLDDAVARARDVEAWLQCAPDRLIEASLTRSGPPRVGDPLDAARAALQVFTLTRVVDADGALDLHYNGPPDGRPDGTWPWFDAPGRRWTNARVVFGHWAALGVRITRDAVGLDSGCVWGGALTAWRVDDGALVQVDAREP